MKTDHKLKIIAGIAGLVMLVGFYLEYKKSKYIPIPRTTTNKTVCLQGEKYFDKEGNPIKPDVTYKIVNEELSDTPIKTQIDQSIGLEGKFDRDVVVKVLELSYNVAKTRNGFEYYNPANSYAIYVYADTDRAKARVRYLGQLSHYKNMETFRIDLNEELIVASQEPEQDKWGYTEKQRKQIFNALANPDDLSKSIIDSIYTTHSLKPAIVDSIRFEGGLKAWAWNYWYKKP